MLRNPSGERGKLPSPSAKTRLKVLQVTPFYPPDKGGIPNHVSSICKSLGPHNIDVTVLCPCPIRPKLAEVPTEATSRIIRLPSFYLPGWPYPTLRSISVPFDLGRRIDRIIREGKFDIVHVHGHHYPLSWLAIRSARKHKVPSVLTLHGMYALNPKVMGGRSALENAFNRVIFSRLLGRSSAVIGLTRQITEYALEYGPTRKNSKARYFTISNGTNASLYRDNLSRKQEFRKKYDLSESSTVISFIGRFEHVKAVSEFASAAKLVVQSHKNAEFLIIGGGSLENEVRSICQGVERVHVLPWQNPDKIHEFFIASDIFAIPSRFEALPLTVIEAMSAGLHIVYTPVGGVPDVLEEYKEKTKIENSSVQSLQSVLARLLQEKTFSPERNPVPVSAGSYDWSKISAATLKVYQQLTGKGAGP